MIRAEFDNPLPKLQTPLLSTPILRHAHAAKAQETPDERKLRQAAGQFESMLLSSLWKSMKGSFASDDSDYSDPAHETLDDFGLQAMCGAVGKAGGLGIANLIVKHLEPKLAASQKGKGGGAE